MASSRVNEIDLLRFLAALSVVLFHYAFRGYAADGMSVMPYPLLAPAARYGYLGVELFFLISGFVILMTASSGSLRNFMVSRAVRLYPAFWICCTITFLAIVLFGGSHYSASVGQYLANMTLLGGFTGVAPIDGVYWSLFVELQFYALVAILLAIGKIRHAQVFLVLWLLAVLFIEVVPVPKTRFLLIADYAAYFIAGAIAFLVWSSGPSPVRIAAYFGAWGLAVCQSVRDLVPFEEHYRTQMSGAAVAAVVTAMFAIVLLVAMRATGALGRQRWLALGALTYPLYLLHQNLGFMIFNAAWPAIDPHLLFWATLALMLLAAHAVNVLAERKLSGAMKAFLNRALDRLPARDGLPQNAAADLQLKHKALR